MKNNQKEPNDDSLNNNNEIELVQNELSFSHRYIKKVSNNDDKKKNEITNENLIKLTFEY